MTHSLHLCPVHRQQSAPPCEAERTQVCSWSSVRPSRRGTGYLSQIVLSSPNLVCAPGEAGGFCCGRAPGWNPAGGHLAGNPALQRYQSSIPVAGRAQHPPARYGQGQGLLLSLIVMSTAESAWCFPSAPGKYSRSLQASWVASGL